MSLAPLPVPSMLRDYGLQPKKGLGQNFLVEDTYLQRIVEAAGVTSADEVLEIGAGLGSLTRYLADAAGKVCAVEIDSRFTPVLKKVLKEFSNVNLVNADIMDIDVGQWMHQPGYLVVANIPYYITSAVIRHLLETPLKPARMVLTVQREVAERITAAAGKLSLLALSVQVYGQPQKVALIPAGAFYPSPKVDSAVVRVELFPEPLIPPAQLDTFFTLARAGFGQKRKTLRNALAAGLGWKAEKTAEWLQAAGIDPQRRAETLSLPEWRTLVSAYTQSAEGLPKHSAAV